MPDPDQEDRDREQSQRVRREVDAVWERTADALRRLALLEIETALIGREES